MWNYYYSFVYVYLRIVRLFFGSWVNERSNLAVEFAKAFGGRPGTLIHLAVASDGDNTRSKVRAASADIHFVGRDEPCLF